MQCDESGSRDMWQQRRKIERMDMNDVGRILVTLQRCDLGVPSLGLYGIRSGKTRGRHQRTFDSGTLGGDNGGTMTMRDQGRIKRRQNLLSSADRIGSNRRQRISDTQNPEHSSSSIAAAALSPHNFEVRPQGWLS